MSWINEKSLKSKIGRLTREIEEIDRFSYPLSNDLDLRAGMLERKRDDVVRMIVLQIHTATEDVLTSWIRSHIVGADGAGSRPKRQTNRSKALDRILYGAGSMGFDMKLSLAVALGLINEPTRKELSELNTIRNKCSHNWLLNTPTRRGRRPRQKKPPLLLFRGQDLHRVPVLEGFVDEFGALYAKLWVKSLD